MSGRESAAARQRRRKSVHGAEGKTEKGQGESRGTLDCINGDTIHHSNEVEDAANRQPDGHRQSVDPHTTHDLTRIC